MVKLISQNQSSFILGKDIVDNIKVAQEVVHSWRNFRGNKCGMTMKIDLENDYDRISWDFLRDTLLMAGILEQLISVILHCISSTSPQVLWSVTLTNAFQLSRGIRQGDPLSPYLFVHCMERLGHIIEEATVNGSWNPLFLSSRGPFCLKFSLLITLCCFVKLVGIKLLCQVDDLGCYLGMPLFHNRATVHTFDFIVSKDKGNLHYEEIEWQTLFVILCWLLWKNRNECVFFNSHSSIGAIVDTGYMWAKSYRDLDVQMKSLGTMGSLSSRISLVTDWIKLNSDGAVSNLE
ncbi:hypothetical protein PVK06_040016 [Gossypium arboreum]|uniref:Reverse transcriptase domain-containing protein n=1 Tax=Gossypium arboreum TaxID=29729 RepID=A0ABR0N521_GOSAR|nr:hypothetical protein PVK06_040016 [Gossypium arboreum]